MVWDWVFILVFVPFFLKDFLLLPFAIGEAKTKKDYIKTLVIAVVVIALIVGWAGFMDYLIVE